MSRRKPIAVILTAISIENTAIKEHLQKLKPITKDDLIYEKGIFKGKYHEWNVYARETGQKNIPAALATERAIKSIKPDVIFYVGIAGGVKDLKICDVLAVEKAYDYESARVEKGRTLTRPEMGYSSSVIYERAKFETSKKDWISRIKGNHDCRNVIAKHGAIASGSKLIASEKSDLVKIIKSSYNDTLAVDMEGNGFFQAVSKSKTEALLVRGISDLLKNKSTTDSQGFQVLASKNAAAFAFEVLSKLKV